MPKNRSVTRGDYDRVKGIRTFSWASSSRRPTRGFHTCVLVTVPPTRPRQLVDGWEERSSSKAKPQGWIPRLLAAQELRETSRGSNKSEKGCGGKKMAPSVATSPKKRKEIASCGKEKGKKSGCKPRVLVPSSRVFFYEQRSLRRRRCGDAYTMSGHHRHTCTRVCRRSSP